MEFMTKKEAKNMKDKHFHLYIFEEIPIIDGTPGTSKGKHKIEYTYRPLLDC
jgi:hypothetical protein